MTIQRLTPRQLRRRRRDQALAAWSFHQMAQTTVRVVTPDGPLYVSDLHRLYLTVKYSGGQLAHQVISDGIVRLELIITTPEGFRP
jgi:hypothetical protein